MMKRRILLRSWTFASAVVLLVLASISDGVSEEIRYQWRRTEFAFTTTGCAGPPTFVERDGCLPVVGL
jgi:hypothetical protein